MRKRPLVTSLLLLASVILGSCNEPTALTAGRPASLEIVSGDAQSGIVSTRLGQPLVARVLDAQGRPVPGQLVNFVVASGGGSVFAGSSLTNENGVAQELWTLGPSTSGSQVVEARAVDATSGAPLVFGVFHATALPGPAAAIAMNSGNAQSGVVATAVGVAPSVLVTDASGNPVPGVTVIFAVASGGGSITGATATTNSLGIATVGSWTLGTTAGANTLTATSAGLTGSPFTFAATSTAGSPTAMSISAGNGQTAPVGTAVPASPAVRVVDGFGNVVAGVVVTFAPGSGGGSITGATATTNSLGIATVGSWTLGTTAGANTLTATSAGLTGSPFTFAATGAAGAPQAISVSAGNNQTASVGTPVSTAPSVRVTDAYGNVVAGAVVTFAAGLGGGSITGATATTNSLGIATVGSWTLGPSAGPNTLVATAAGLAGSSLTFTALGTPGAATRLLVNGGDAQSGVVNAVLTTAPSVKAVDAHGNGVSGVAISWAITSGGGSLATLTTTTDASGITAADSWRLGTTAGLNTLSATSAELTGSPITFTATGTASSPFTVVVNAGNNQTAIVGTAVPTPPSVRVTDAYGNIVSGGVVTFAVTGGGGSISGATATANTLGIATVGSWTLGPTVGPNTLRATVPGGQFPASFTASGTTGASAVVTIVAGDQQQSVVNSTAAVAPKVRVADQSGNAVAGASVSFVVTSGGGSVSVATAITDNAGHASAGEWTFGATPGTNTLEARVTGATPAVFTGTAYPQFVATSVVWTRGGKCALDGTGALFCWGGHLAPFNAAVPTAVGAQTFTSLSTGPTAEHICALTSLGEAFCWGNNTHGQLGDLSTIRATSPVAVSGGITFTAIATALRATCGLSSTGSVYCWGDNNFGALGDGTLSTRGTPLLVSGSVSFTKIVAGSQHMCGLAVDSTAYCWGFLLGEPGTLQLCGNSVVGCILTPTPVAGGRRFASITAGFGFSCGLTAAGAVYCWGDGSGFGSVVSSHIPALVTTSQVFTSIAAGNSHMCGITSSGRAYCWGQSFDGAMGIGTTAITVSTPTAVAGDLTFAMLSPSCGIAVGGELWCWGAYLTGTGSSVNVYAPRRVIRR